MCDRRGVAGVALPAWLLASSTTAAFSHALIAIFGEAGIGADRYAEHAHGAVIPLAILALNGTIALLLFSTIRALRAGQPADRVASLARRFRETSLLGPSLSVAAGGLATLVCMELGEQWSALGHVVGIDDALGGNLVVGSAIVFTVAAIVTVVTRHCAAAVVSTAVAAVGALVSWMVRCSISMRHAAVVRVPRRRTRARTARFFERGFALRAPPFSTTA